MTKINEEMYLLGSSVQQDLLSPVIIAKLLKATTDTTNDLTSPGCCTQAGHMHYVGECTVEGQCLLAAHVQAPVLDTGGWRGLLQPISKGLFLAEWK